MSATTRNEQNRKQQKEATRLRLIETAAQLFTENGIASTATANVAKAMKVSHGTVFLHFPRREDLILTVIEDFGVKLSKELSASISAESTLEKVLKAHIRTLAQFENFYFRLLTEFHSLPESVRGTLFLLNSNVSWRMYESASPMMKAGKLKKIDRPKFTNTWIALLHYYIANREQLSNKKPILSDQGDALVKHFLALIET